MGRPRAFDEAEVVRSAASLFAGRAYDGISIDDLVTHLGIHRNSIYKTFGSKRGLYLAALRWHLHHQVRPLLVRISEATSRRQALHQAFATTGSTDLGLLLLAAVERAPVDREVAEEITSILHDFDAAVDPDAEDNHGAVEGTRPSGVAGALTAAILGLHLRARTSADLDASHAGAALLHRIRHQQ